MHAPGTEALALCGNDASPEQITTDALATCWECRSIIGDPPCDGE